ncbi:MAG: PIN domain-containing protein [Clostridiales bacterium]|nr:PIN domain-containing protein [Clostridiales bacterium]
MKTVFVDTNVILDVLLENEGLWEDSRKVYRLAELGYIQAFVSASSMTDIFYIARKKLTVPVARSAIEKLLSIFIVVGIDGDDLRGALTLPIDDMEDALQVWCAQKINAEALLTNDRGGFAKLGEFAITPADFVAL